MDKVYIHTEFIKLQQVLKLAGLIDQGSDVKYYLSKNMVYVNNEIATERGKKIRHRLQHGVLQFDWIHTNHLLCNI